MGTAASNLDQRNGRHCLLNVDCLLNSAYVSQLSDIECQCSDRYDDRTSEFRINPSSAGLVSIAVSIIMGLDTHCGNDTAKRFLVEV